MYWTHLIFALLYSVLLHWNQITASKPGYLDFDNLPETNFSCEKKVIGGYYADVETGCQMFHVCTIGQKGEVTDIKFLCLNGTVFDQETRVCERIDEVDCSKSEDFFGLNLELYGNNANLGIQPENEFECEDCSTDDDYEESEESTTIASPSTTSTTTTTTTPKPTTTTTASTTLRPIKYQTSNQDTIAALLALHNAFRQGLQNTKVKAPPPRVINNAFAPTKPTAKPYTTQPTTTEFKPINYHADSQSFGSLNLQQQERPYYFTPTSERTNYHHFHSGDTSFGHSYDSTRPYNFQYFHARKLPEVQGTVSVVTSTSTSTSVRTSKGNTTFEYPTGYEDYQDDVHDVQDAFFADVPKLRQKRTVNNNNHSKTQFQDSEKHFDKYYDFEKKLNDREEFLQNLLGSIDMEDRMRDKVTSLFKKEETEMEELENPVVVMNNLGNKLGQKTNNEQNINKDKDLQEHRLVLWNKNFDDMQKDINLNYTFETEIKDIEDKIRRKKRETSKNIYVGATGNPALPRRTQNQQLQTTSPEPQVGNRRKVLRQKIDTEKFNFGSNRRGIEGRESKPVFEAIEDDFTTIEYRKTSRNEKEQPRTTTNLRRNLKFNYETTSHNESEGLHKLRPMTNIRRNLKSNHETTSSYSEQERIITLRPRTNLQTTKVAPALVFEEREYIATTSRATSESVVVGARRSRKRIKTESKSTMTTATTQIVSESPSPDPNFSCEGKVKGGFYADMYGDCKGFFICSQGEINGPLLKTHFWCGATTKFNQRSRTCQAESLVECSVSPRYFHLNNDFLVPESEDELKGSFEPLKVS